MDIKVLNDLVGRAEDRVEQFKRLQQLGLICLSGDFFPSVHYPPITMYAPVDEHALYRDYVLPPNHRFDVYVHIPFCAGHCLFCHYPVKVGDQPAEKDKYIDALTAEIDLFLRRFSIDKIQARSVLIGGGTPTYMRPVQLERFFRNFADRVDAPGGTQFNVDLDPNTLLGKEGDERIHIMKDYGVNRLTIGIQSLDDAVLRKMNRHHDAKEAREAVRKALSEGFIVNIEFIYGYPGQTVGEWLEMLYQAIELQPDEIQLYRLKIQPYGDRRGTVLNHFLNDPGSFPAVEDVIQMKQAAGDLLDLSGYHQNLVRVFSKDPGVYSHYADNQCCKLFDQVGFGLTAFSSLRDRFGLNTQNFNEYYANIEKGLLPVNRGLIRDDAEQCRWAIILPLKNRIVYKAPFLRQTGVALDAVFRNKINRLIEYGLLIEDEKSLSLTEDGRFFADEVCTQFYSPQYNPFPESAYARGPLNPYNPD